MTRSPEDLSGHTGLDTPENFLDTFNFKPQRNFVDTRDLKARRNFVDTPYADRKLIMALAIGPNSVVAIPRFT